METIIRAATVEDARAIAAVHVASWRTTYRGIIDEKTLSALSVERRAAYWQQTLTDQVDVVYVAVDDAGEIVGFASGGAERDGDTEYSGEMYTIYLLAEMHGQGIGRNLATRLLTDIYHMGHNNILVWVLEKNPATKFYAAMGATPVRERNITIAGAVHRELGYGWRG